MAYDKELAHRIREGLQHDVGVTERAMFGGLAFMIDGHMAVGAGSRGDLMLRCDPAQVDDFVAQAHVDRFEMRGRPMNGWLGVGPGAVTTDDDLRHWVRVGVDYARSLPPK